MNHRRFTRSAFISLCFCIGLSLPAIADINEARRLAEDGQTDQALAHVVEMLRAQPDDIAARLLHGVLLPAEQGAAQARERIAQLRAKNVTDLIIIARGEYANGISLGVFAKRSGAQRRLATLAEKDVHAQIAEHRTSAARDNATVIAHGPFNTSEFTREFAQINYEISHDINNCR